MNLFVKDKNFYKQLAAIAIPVSLQNLITFSVSMADTVMVGTLGEVQLSAVAIANQLGFVFMLLSFGTGGGASVLIAQFWGKRDIDSINKVITIMYRILILASLVFMSLALFFPRQVITVFTSDAQVISEGVKFIRIVGLSYLFAGIASCTVIMLRSVGTVKISLIVYISSLAVSVFFNWVLIFGNLGAPALGVEGAAISTCIARTVEVSIILIYLIFFEKKICYKAKMLFAKKLDVWRNFLENAMPVVINELIWGSGSAIIVIIIGRMGREFTAANAVCGVVSQLVTIALFGIANAAGVIIGNTVGKGEYQLVKEYSKTLEILSLFLGFISCGVVLLLKKPMISLYNISPLAKIYADQIMTIHAVVVIFIAIAAMALLGILRAAGDSRFVLAMDVGFMWLLCIPFGFFAGLYLNWPVWAVYIIIKFDELLKAIFCILRIARDNWINDVTLK